MSKIKVSVLGSLLLLAGTLAAAADTGVVVGDSLGVGVSMASHLRSFAKNSVSIRATGATDQIERAPEGSTVFLSLGTNDAVGNVDGLSGGIKRVIAAAERAKVHLVWMGPPCVFKPWDANAKKLDAELKSSLSGTGVTYVSMQNDARLCDRSVRARDGVHFSMTGYNAMWAKARSAAGFSGGSIAVADTGGDTPTTGATKPKSKSKKTAALAKGKRGKKKYARRRGKGKPAVKQTAAAPAAAPAPAPAPAAAEPQ